MPCVAVSTEIVKKVVDAIKDLSKETTLYFGREGIRLQAMDSSHVSLIQMKLQECVTENTHENEKAVGLSLDNFSKLIRMCDGTEVRIDTDRSDSIFIRCPGERNCNFSVPLLDIDMESMDVPDFRFDAGVSMNSCDFSRVVRELKEFDEHVVMEVSKNGIAFSTTGRSAECNVELPAGKSVIVEMTSDSPVRCELSLKYLSYFSKASPLSDMVIVQIGSESPASFRFQINSTDFMTFFLAPKVEA